MSSTEPPVSLHQVELNAGQRYSVSSDASKNSVYLLPADEQERERLNIQSESINAIFDNKLIWAPLTLKDGDTVLDSGTGSGHWLLTLATQIPATINLRGIDLSPRMFPPAPLTPPNVDFKIQPLTSLPADWTNSIALIHQRFLVLALQAHQWKAALSEMYRVLTPGGWAEFCEPDHLLSAPSKAIVQHKVMQIRDAVCRDVCHTVVDITDNLGQWLQDAGFVNIKIEKRNLPMGAWGGELGKRGLNFTVDVHHFIGELALKAGGLGFVKTREEYDVIIKDFERAFEETPESYWPFSTIVAQKPVHV